MMTVNVTGVFLCTKAVLPLMKRQRSGKIVNIASSAGRSTSTFGGAHYTTSKAAVLGLTRHTAREATPYQINVNAIAPGSMDTDMVRELATPEHIAREEKAFQLVAWEPARTPPTWLHFSVLTRRRTSVGRQSTSTGRI